MLPLHGSSPPANAHEMSASLREGLRRVVHFTTDSRDTAVQIHGDFPDLQRLEIDFSESLLHRPPHGGNPIGTGQLQPGPSVQQLVVTARPMYCEGVPVHFELSADDVRFDFDRDQRGQSVLVPRRAQGTFRGQVPQSGLEDVLLSVAREAAAKQKVSIHSTQLTLHHHQGPRTLKAIVRVQATKRIGFVPLSGAFLITGRLDVSDDLVAQISELGCEGEGGLASLVAPLIAARLHELDQMQLELAAIPLGEIRLQDLQVGVSDTTLLLEAAFGT